MIPQLPEGWTAEYQHIHEKDDADIAWRAISRTLHPRRSAFMTNGTTLCVVRNEEGHIVATGCASACPKDQFSKPLGRQISLGRALKNMTIDGAVVGRFHRAKEAA